jgi:hypothetical protein
MDTDAAAVTEPPNDVDPAYWRLAETGPHAPRLGSALITWVEPDPAFVREYNRWYEDDHMITGAMVMPWMFSARRFVATRRLQALRFPADSALCQPLERGKYIGIYWINEDRLADHEQWALGANYRLHREGRGSCRGLVDSDPTEERTHVLTNFNDYNGATYRDAAVPRDVNALVDPPAGLVVEVVRADEGVDRRELDGWLEHDHLPGLVTAGGPVRQALRFSPRPLPGNKLSHVYEPEGIEQLVTTLLFLDRDPADCWSHFEGLEADVRASGLGRLDIAAPFIPTKHGTDVYVDELF